MSLGLGQSWSGRWPAEGGGPEVPPVPAQPGRLALVSQSGALVTAILDWARGQGIGFSRLVSLGEHADIDFGDMLDWLASELVEGPAGSGTGRGFGMKHLHRLICTSAAYRMGSSLKGAEAAVAADPGPAFSVPDATLDAAVTCQGDLAGSALTPVLLVPGTTLTPELNFSWNYEKVFTAQGRPWCAVTLPANGMLDIQVAGEYVAMRVLGNLGDPELAKAFAMPTEEYETTTTTTEPHEL